MDHPPNPRKSAEDAFPADETARALSPLPIEPRHAPPVDVDRRKGHVAHDDNAIPIPDHHEIGDDIGTQIDETLPTPTEPADDTEPAPADAIDAQIDETLPLPDEQADPLTPADLDDETAFSLEAPDASATESSASAEVLTSLTMDAPDAVLGDDPDAIPVNSESDTVASTSAFRATEPGTSANEATAPAGTPLIADGTTTCPTCGRETSALRFCGYCGATLTGQSRTPTAETPFGRLQERAGMLLEPVTDWLRAPFVRLVLAAGAVLLLIALLANSGGLALMLASAILPILLVYAFMQLDVFETEPPLVIAGVGLAGALIGAVLGWIGSWSVASNWFDTGVLNYGAVGFGGRFAEAAGNAPFIVWAINGLVLPLAAIAAIVGIPMALRQSMSLRNEVMDGLTLGGAIAAGISIGGTLVFAAPMLAGGGPASDASTWTLTTIGLTILRPLVWTLTGAMLGAAVWRYLRTQRVTGIIVPVAGSVGVLLIYALVGVSVGSMGLWPEVLWGLLMAIIAGTIFRMVLHSAIEEDRKVLGNDNSRVVCPNCRQVTPGGAFCAHCGHSLVGATA